MSIQDPSDYKTGDAVPSNKAMDLNDNAKVFDVFQNEKIPFVKNRLGVNIPTIFGVISGFNQQVNSQYIYKNGGVWADAPDQITDSDKLTYWTITRSDGQEEGYAVKGYVALPIDKPATPINDSNWFLATSVNKDQLRTDSASQIGLVYLNDWNSGIVIPSNAMDDKLAVWNNGKFYSIGTDTGFTSTDFDADLAAGRFITTIMVSGIYYFDTVADMKPVPTGNTIITRGYHEVNDGGGCKYKQVPGYNPDGLVTHGLTNGSSAVPVSKVITSLQAGAIPDFTRTAPYGTPCLANFQAATDYLAGIGGGTFDIIEGDYYLGTGYCPDKNVNLKIQWLIGSYTSEGKPFVNGIKVKGNGSQIFAGTNGRMLSIGRAKNCDIHGLTFFHTTIGNIEGVYGIINNSIRIGESCENINIYDNYLTNHLSWGIDFTTNWEDPASDLYHCFNINVYKNTIKTRWGNGVRTYETLHTPPPPYQGNGGAWVIAVINGSNINIYDNTFYGDIDLENNHASQTFRNINIHDNQHYSGWVTPQFTIGEDYWHDEPLNPVGTSNTIELPGGCYFIGVGLNTPSTGVIYKDNFIEKGKCWMWQNYRLDTIDNVFVKGRIELGYTISGTEQITDSLNISGNRADTTIDPLDGEGFISIKGLLTNAVIDSNYIKDIATSKTITVDPSIARGFDASCDFNNNRMVPPYNIVKSRKYRVFITPYMCPSCAVDITATMYSGEGLAYQMYETFGLPASASTYEVDLIKSKTTGSGVTISQAVKQDNGVFYIDVEVASSTADGVLTVSSPDSHAGASIVDIT